MRKATALMISMLPTAELMGRSEGRRSLNFWLVLKKVGRRWRL
ncbi:hypothetical protein [Thermococcus sp.]|nr:hypothetical protein [Thermococcus sp.]